jgi:hypothetical protein
VARPEDRGWVADGVWELLNELQNELADGELDDG